MLSHVKFVDLPVTDLERALAFYTGTLGFQLKWREPGEDGWDFVELGIEGAQTRIVLIRRQSPASQTGPALHLIDTNLGDTIARWRAAGVDVVEEPHPAPWDPGTTLCTVRDSEGNLLLLETH